MKFKINVLTLTFFAMGFMLQAQVLRDEIIINFPLNEDALDYSGNDLHGNIYNDIQDTDRFSGVNGSYFFDGETSQIEIPHNPLLKPELPITIAMWVNPVEVTSNKNQLFTNDDHPDFYSGITFQIHPAYDGGIAISAGTGGGSGPANRKTAFGQTPLVPQTWTHVVGVIRSEEDMDIYINGVKDSIIYDGYGDTLIYSESPARIGAYDGNINGDMRYYNGKIDDIKMWSAALNEEQVLAIYNEFIWDMPVDGGAFDVSGNTIDGIANLAPLVADRFGNAESAFAFDGYSSNIEIPNHPMFKPQIPFSISMWVNIDDINYEDNVLFTNDDHPDVYSGIIMRTHNNDHSGKIVLNYGTGGGSGYQNRRTAISTSLLESGKWHHIVGIVRGPQDMDIFIDGVKDSVIYSGTGGNIFYTDQPGRIGAYDGSINHDTKFFRGQMDEFKMWNRAITNDEIETLYTPGTVSSVQESRFLETGNLLIFPNPASNFIQIKNENGTSSGDYWIYTTQGRVVQVGTFEGYISTQSLPSGTYVLKVNDDEKTHVKFFVKK